MYTWLKIRGIFRGCRINNLRSILEVGCGEMREISRLKAAVAGVELIVGIDIKLYEKWKHLTQIDFIVADAHYLPLKSSVFDFVFLKDVLHHIPENPSTVIKEAFRCVKNGGLLRVIEANRYDVNSIIVYKSDRSHQHFTRRELNKFKKLFSFNELYGYELLPSFSPFKRDFLWNIFAGAMFLLTGWSITRRILLLYINLKERFLKGFLRYYVLSKRKPKK
ncbi:MAG: class I SAM-dependent methyltransferase [Candidatus Baldrarchaeia archaeon]